MIINVDGVADSDGEVFKLLPVGIYSAEIVGIEQKAVKNEASKMFGLSYLNFSYKVEDEDSGVTATVFDMIMLPVNIHGDDTGVMNAEDKRKCAAKLNVMQNALGLDPSDAVDTDLFLHGTCQVEVGVKAAKGEYPAGNTVKTVLPL